MAFLLQLLPPLLLCFPVLFVMRAMRNYKHVSATAFLLSQIFLIIATRVAPWQGLLAVGIFVGGFVFFLKLQEKRIPSADFFASVFFVMYLVYWYVEKYIIPWGLQGAWMFESENFNQAYLNFKTIAIVGISFMGFKLIAFWIDWRSGDIKKVQAIEFLIWLFFFPSLIAGPIQRYQDWILQRQQHLSQRSYWVGESTLTEGLQRILIGLLLKFVLGDSIYGLSIEATNIELLKMMSWHQIAFSAACYSLYLYWDFSGYSHIAVGSALMWGIRLPENFKHPFFARNLAEFWQRWHISFSELLRDYLFYPLSLKLKRSRTGKGQPWIAVCIPPLITFLVAGVWHGAALGFALYGLTHGIGLACLAMLKRRKITSVCGKWWMSSKLGHCLASLITFTYVSISFIFFALPHDSLMVLVHRLI